MVKLKTLFDGGDHLGFRDGFHRIPFHTSHIDNNDAKKVTD